MTELERLSKAIDEDIEIDDNDLENVSGGSASRMTSAVNLINERRERDRQTISHAFEFLNSLDK